MNSHNATYYFNSVEYPATMLLDKAKLVIRFDETQNEVFWYYEQIKIDKAPQTFYYPGSTLQTLEVQSSELADELKSHIEKSQKKGLRNRTGLVVTLSLAVMAFIMLTYFFFLPWLAAAMVGSFPVSYEKQLGDGMYASMKENFEVDAPKTAYINDFFNELHFASNYDIHITVVKSDIANAFALPGGRIVVHDRLLAGIGTYEELAALLAHEFTHVENRHSLHTMFRRLGIRILFSWLLGDDGSIGSILIGKAEDLKNLSYSRRLEKEADEEGVRLLAHRHIDCNGFVRLFQFLKQESKGEQPAEWLSSHPDLERRIDNIQKNSLCQQSSAVQIPELKTLFLKLKTAE